MSVQENTHHLDIENKKDDVLKVELFSVTPLQNKVRTEIIVSWDQ